MAFELLGGQEPPFEKRAQKESVAHDRQMSTAAPAREMIEPMAFDPRPHAVDSIMEVVPALAPRRIVVRQERIRTQLGVGRPAQVAEVALFEIGMKREGDASRALDCLRRLVGAAQMARPDLADRLPREAASEADGLCETAIGERRLGDLDDAIAIARGFTVADEEDAHGAQRSEGDGGGASGRATRGLLVNRGGEGREQPREIFRLDE